MHWTDSELVIQRVFHYVMTVIPSQCLHECCYILNIFRNYEIKSYHCMNEFNIDHKVSVMKITCCCFNERGCVRSCWLSSCSKTSYYMASSGSGQDEPNPELWLATQVVKMELSWSLGNTLCIRSLYPLINLLFTKFSWWRWLYIGLVVVVAVVVVVVFLSRVFGHWLRLCP